MTHHNPHHRIGGVPVTDHDHARRLRPPPGVRREVVRHVVGAAAPASDPVAVRLAQGNLPASTDIHRDPPLDQGQTSSCTAHALTKGVEILTSALGSQRVLYSLTGARQGDLSDSGRQCSDTIAVAREQGLAPFEGDVEGRHSDITTANATTPATYDETRAALAHLVNLLPLRIDPALPDLSDRVVASLAIGSPVYLGTEVGAAFEDLGGGVVAQPTPASDTSGGGHALLIVGHRTNADGTRDFKVENSWGESWDERGECWASLAWVAACWELYPLALAAGSPSLLAEVVDALRAVT